MLKGVANGHLENLKFRYDIVAYYKGLETAHFGKSPMAQRSYKISSISVQLFSLYQITTDKHQL
jgi:hypothetical protein